MRGYYVRQDTGGPHDPTMRYVPSLSKWLKGYFADKKYRKTHRIHKSVLNNPNIIFVEHLDYQNPRNNI